MKFNEQYIKDNYRDFLNKKIPFPFYFFKDIIPDYEEVDSVLSKDPKYLEYLKDSSEDKTLERIELFIKNYPQHEPLLYDESIVEIPVEDLQRKLAKLLLEYEDLTTNIGPAIEYAYAKLFGILEIELYKLEMEISMLKMKIKEIQKYINRQEQIPLDEVNRKINEEFKEYKEKIEDYMDDYEEIMKKEFIEISQEETKDIKRKYKRIIMKLHPDINKNLTEKEKSLLIQANIAYHMHDIDTINQIYEVLKNKDSDEIIDDAYLKEQIEKVKKKIEDYKENYPYNKKDLINNPADISEYKTSLKNMIKEYKEAIDNYNMRIEEMIQNESSGN